MTHKLFTDSSSHSAGTWMNGMSIQNTFNSKQQKLHINIKELLAIVYALTSFKYHLKNSSLLIHCDSQVAISTIKCFGSSNLLRDRITREIYNIIHQCNASLSITFIKSADNYLADALSRIILKSDSTKWKISKNTFTLIKEHSSHKLDIDLFVSSLNHQLPCFASWTTDKGAEIIDAFTITWKNFTPFLNPPFSLWSQVLH